MARAIIRAIPLYLDGKKFAEVQSGSYDILSGDEMHIATEGYFGHSDGATTVKITPSIIVPVRGTQVPIDSILLSKRYVQAGVPVNGKIHQVDVRATGLNYKWDFKSGSCTGDMTLEGGAPDLAG